MNRLLYLFIFSFATHCILVRAHNHEALGFGFQQSPVQSFQQPAQKSFIPPAQQSFIPPAQQSFIPPAQQNFGMQSRAQQLLAIQQNLPQFPFPQTQQIVNSIPQTQLLPQVQTMPQSQFVPQVQNVPQVQFVSQVQTVPQPQLIPKVQQFQPQQQPLLQVQPVPQAQILPQLNTQSIDAIQGQFSRPVQPNLMDSFLQTSQNAMLINKYAQTGIKVAQELLNMSPNDPTALLRISDIKAPIKFCPFKGTIECDSDFPYRSFDGSCNNLKNLWWGRVETPYKRILDPAYADLLNEPRHSIDGSELPNARDIVCSLHSESYEIEPFITHIFMQWGQFISHDITSLSISKDEEKNISICNTCTKSEKCLPILITNNKACNCISQMSHPCIEFTRSSASFPDTDCSIGNREQLNLQTPFLDASHVYGTKVDDNIKIRDTSSGKGRLLVQQQNNLLPQDKTARPSDCLDFTEEQRCFRGGDDRVNQNVGFMSFHTLFVREHNRIADSLSNINPSWEDETVFQEARRVVIAQIQHITYNEYLPILLGQSITKQLNLVPGKGTEQSSGYSQDLDPRIANEYAAAAGRFGHSMVRSTYSRLDSDYKTSGANSFMLRHAFFRANMLYDQCQGGLESVVRGLLKDPVMKVDRWFSDELTQHLFETKDEFGRPFHFDLASINIQRGRDHGIPGYVKFRELCGLTPIRTWDDMKMAIPEDVVQIFSGLYKFVEDVDLFSAGVSEIKQDGSLIGPTLACVVSLQFRDLKFGDRFWYETNQAPAAFTPNQLAEIRKTSLSKLLCRNMDNTPKIQPHAFISSKLKDNSLMNCTDLSDINWSLWSV